MASEMESVLTYESAADEILVSETTPGPAAGELAGTASFPKVLRRRLDRFFVEQEISPKADRLMWFKIVAGMAVLAGSWITLYALRPDAWKFVALYLLGGLAQTFLLLNIAHDSNHNAISSRPAVNKVLNYAFDLCGINSYMWRILHHRGHHSCVNVHGEDDALTGRGLFRFTPHEPHRAQLAPLPASLRACLLYAVFSLDYVFVQRLSSRFSFRTHDYLKRTKHPAQERYAILFAGKAFLLHLHACAACRFCLVESPYLVGAGAFLIVHLIVGLSRYRWSFKPRTPIDDDVLPNQTRSEFDNSGLPYLRDHGGLRDELIRLSSWLNGRTESPHCPSSLPVCMSHALRFSHEDRAGDCGRVWYSVPSASHDERGDLASSDPAETAWATKLTHKGLVLTRWRSKLRKRILKPLCR